MNRASERLHILLPAAISLFVFFLFFIGCLSFPTLSKTMPLLISSIGMLLSALDYFLRWRKIKRGADESDTDVSASQSNMLRLLTCGVCFGVFLAVTYILGYFVGLTVASLSFAYTNGLRKVVPLISYTLITAVLVFVIFKVILGLPLPTGFIAGLVF